MTRRKVITSAAGAAALAGSAAAQTPRKSIFELRWIRMRNGTDSQVQRTTQYLNKAVLPALQRAGVGPVGVFSGLIASDGPFILVAASFPSLAGYEAAEAKIAAAFDSDKALQKERDAYYGAPGLGYVRIETSLLRGFDSLPHMEVPSTEGRTSNRIFELRIYESNNLGTLRRKMKMFDDGEIAIFRKYGIQPVFFGETIVGGNQPNLTYLVSYDNLAAREKAWSAFGSSPEWQKMRVLPGLSDAEVVSNISNMMLRPLPFSAIR